MNARALLWIGVLTLLPLAGGAAEPAAPAPATTATPAKPAPGAFDLKNAAVQDLVRTTAASASEDATPPDTAVAHDEKLADLRFRGPRRPHYMECDALACTAFTKDKDPLYSISREQMGDQSLSSEHSFDQWLSCQQGNDLLSTFERFDKCRGITIGLPPLEFRDVEIRRPPLAL
jgi:hypothetical protein